MFVDMRIFVSAENALYPSCNVARLLANVTGVKLIHNQRKLLTQIFMSTRN